MPDWRPDIRRRLASLHLSPAREAEIVEELSQHLDDRRRDLIAAGASEAEATRRALDDFRADNLLARRLASLRQANHVPPTAPGTPSRHAAAGVGRDLRFALRVLSKQPGFTITAVATLALAIGATTAIFAVADALLLRPLPFPDSHRLVQLGRAYPGAIESSVSIPNFMQWRQHGRGVFVAAAAYHDLGSGFNLIGSGQPERVIGTRVSAAFFDVLGVAPALGRSFREAEDVPGGPKLVVLSDGLWRTRFAARPEILGEAIVLNGEPHTVIGVMPPNFQFPDVADLWTLSQYDPASLDRANNLEVVARLTDDTSLTSARAAMDVAERDVRRQMPKLMGDHESIGVRPLRERLYGDMRDALLILLGAVGCVLLIGCVNVANLQLAQGVDRRHELALRAALGASSWVVARQLLIESVLLATIGGVAGIGLAYIAVPALVAISPVHIPFASDITVDWRVLGFALALSAIAGVAFGLLPAWQSARPNLEDVLRTGTHRTTGSGGRRMRSALVAAEVALALVLTIGAFLLGKSLVGLQARTPGFAIDTVLTMKLALPEAKYGNGTALAQLQDDLEQRIAAVPGVRAAGLAHTLPLELGSDLPFIIEGKYVPGATTGVHDAEFRPVGPGYFGALQIPLRRGRLFDARDRRGGTWVALVNEAAARRIWPGEDPIGHRITIGQPFVPDLADSVAREIVGVVGDVREEGLANPAPPIVYVPVAQLNERYAALGARLLPFALVVRANATPAALTRSVQEAIWSIDPQQPIADVRPMRDLVARSLGSHSFNTVLLSALAALALLLAAVGLYGVIAHIVSQQTREIGVRLALGATRPRVLTLILRRALMLVGIGVGVGLSGALAITRVLRNLVSGISTNDPWVFVLAPGLMVAVAIVAALWPALRAAAIDPVRALRAE